MTATYLNHAGTTWPKPGVVQAAVADAMVTPPDEWPSRFDQAYHAIAGFFRVAETSRLLLTPGGTSALAVAVHDVPWQEGDRVLASCWEHHALHRQLLKLSERGVETTVIPRCASGPVDLDALWSQLARGGVRLVAATAACNVTGELLPIAEIIRLAHEYDALALIDAAQIAGWEDQNIPATGADLVAFTGHKALHGVWGIGGLYVAPHVALNSPSAVCEIGDGDHAKPNSCATMPGYCDTGSVDRIALAALAAAVDWLDQPVQRDRLVHARERVERITTELESLPQVRLHGPRDARRRLPTVAFTIENASAADIATAFADADVHVSAGLQCAPLAHQTLGTDNGGVVRLSVGAMTTGEDVDRAIAVARRILG